MTKRILVVDDEPSVRDAFELALDELDYEVITACDGVEGVEQAKANAPNLVFLDLRMPRMNGIEALRQIKTLYPDVPVYIVTAFQREFIADLRQLALDGYKFDLAQKPLTAAQICEIVASFLGEE